MYNVSFLFCILSHTINYYYLNTKFQYQCSVLSNRIEFERKWLSFVSNRFELKILVSHITTMNAEKCIDVLKTRLKEHNVNIDTEIVAVVTDGPNVMVRVGKILRLNTSCV